MNVNEIAISQAVKSAVQEFDPGASVVLFGSHARGEARDDSDFDFLVLLKIPLDFRLKSKILDRLYEVELANNCVLGIMIEHKDHWQMLENTPIFSEIQQDGVAV